MRTVVVRQLIRVKTIGVSLGIERQHRLLPFLVILPKASVEVRKAIFEIRAFQRIINHVKEKRVLVDL